MREEVTELLQRWSAGDESALTELMPIGQIKPRYMQIVEMRCLAGLTIEEAAEVLRTSHATVEREWGFARAWLRRELLRESSGESIGEGAQL